MNQINDCIAALEGGGQYNDQLLAYYQANGAVSGTLNDAAKEFFIAQGVGADHLNDCWYEFLTGLGYEGTVNDMLYQFFCIDGGVAGTVFKVDFTKSPPTDVITGQPMDATALAALLAGRPKDMNSGELAGAGEPTIGPQGLLTYGSYTNLVPWSEDISNAAWTKQAGVTIADEGESIWRIDFDDPATEIGVYSVTPDPLLINTTVMLSVELRSDTGEGTVRLADSSGQLSPTLEVICNLTSEWKTYILTGFLKTESRPGVWVRSLEGGLSSVLMRHPQLTETPYRMPYMPTNTLMPLDIELVLNGDFATDTVWNKGPGWTISGGEAHCDGTQVSGTSLSQPGLTLGSTYEVRFTVTARTAGLVRFASGDFVTDYVGAIGDYVYQGTATTGSGNINLNGDLDFIGSVDNVSVKEVVPVPVTVPDNFSNTGIGYMWDFLNVPKLFDVLRQELGVNVTPGTFDTSSGAVSFVAGEVVFNEPDGAYAVATWDGVLEIGKTYKLSYTEISNISGYPKIVDGIASEWPLYGGSEIVIFEADAVNLSMARSPVDVDNIFTFTLEVQEYTLGTGQGGIVMDWIPYIPSDLLATENISILDVLGEGLSGLCYTNSSGALRVYDGVTAVFASVPWVVNKGYRIKIAWGTHSTEGSGKMQIAVTDGVDVWTSDILDFDGSFDPVAYFSMAWGNLRPMIIKSIIVVDTPRNW